MNVIHSIASIHPRYGGPSRTVPRLCEALRDAGIAAQLTVWDEQSPKGKWRSWPVAYGRSRARGFLEDGERQRADIWHDHGLWLGSNHHAARIARRWRIPRVVSPRGMLSRWSLEHHAWKKRLAWVSYQKRDLVSADVLHATSLAEMNAIRRLRLRNPVAVIPNGIDMPPQLQRGSRGTQPHRALFLSRIHRSKGLETLVKAWAQAAFPHWELQIAGPDEAGHRAELQQLVRRLNLEDSVRFSGPVSDQEKWRVYQDADLFVLPSFTENFGLAVAEALASGLPVITTTATPWQVLIEERCGWWIDTGVDPLVCALREAMALTDIGRTEMGARGRDHVERSLSWERIASEMRSTYAWMLGRERIPPCVHTC